MKKVYLIVLIAINFAIPLLAQNNIADMEKGLKNAEGQNKFELLYKISKAYLTTSAKKSLDYGNQALVLAKQLNDKNLEANANNIIGTAYYQLEKYKDAIKTYEDEYAIRKSLKQDQESAKTYYNIGSIYEVWGKEAKAMGIYKEVLAMARTGKFESLAFECYESIIKIYRKGNQYKDAYEYMAQYMAYRSASNITFERKKIDILETQFAEEKRISEETKQHLVKVDSNLTQVKGEKEILVNDTAKKNLKINNLTVETKEQKLTIKEQQEENRRQRQWLIAFVSFFMVILIYSIVLYFQVRAKKKANRLLIQRNAEIMEQKEEITVQAEQLLEKNAQIQESNEEIQTQAEQLIFTNQELRYQHEQITDSINYAKRIQTVMLPSKEFVDELIPENMVLLRPRDIVSGDFYWYKQIKNFIIFAAADCTGHGVPGAFMSMLGMSFLNDIVSKSRFDKPNEILNTLRKRIKKSLNQTGKSNEAADGMDISICVYDTEYNIMQFAGAYNSLYLIRDNELQVYKADRQPVAIYIQEKDFTNHEFKVQKGDCIYLFSDGYKDQFGGDSGQKFKSKRFNQLLLDIHQKPMPEQREILDKTIVEWMDNKYDQIDDILVLGVRI
jgi:serine phosphatase RsbU (regulator of sigma subunit)